MVFSLNAWNTRAFWAPKKVLAIEPRDREWRVVLADRTGRIHAEETFIWEGREDDPELKLQRVWSEFGRHPLAFLLPAGSAVSQLVELRADSPREVEAAIEEETIGLRASSEQAMVYDYSPVGLPDRRGLQAFWVTLCRQAEIDNIVGSLDGVAPEVCCVCNPESALIAACEDYSGSTSGIFVHLSVGVGTLCLVSGGVPIFATTFPSRSVGVDEWVLEDLVIELNRALKSGIHSRSRMAKEFESLEVIQTYLLGQDVPQDVQNDSRVVGRFNFRTPDQELSQFGGQSDSGGLILRGLARIGLLKSKLVANLLPQERWAAWKRGLVLMRMESLAVGLTALTFFLLLVASGQKLSLISQKKELLEHLSSVAAQAETTRNLVRELDEDYERIRPILRRQRQSVDTLRTLSLLSSASSKGDSWFVLFADAHSYGSSRELSTNNVAVTNILAALVPVTASDYDFVAEISIPGNGESMRKDLSELVNALNSNAFFANVDTLSEDRRRLLVNPEVVIPDNHFALSIRLPENEFQYPNFVETQKPPIPVKPVSFADKLNAGAIEESESSVEDTASIE